MKKTTIKVDGMVCGGCEKRVKNALESIEGIKKVDANHKKGIVTISLTDEIETKIIEEKIEDLGFEVVK